jgi:hypothetical protein
MSFRQADRATASETNPRALATAWPGAPPMGRPVGHAVDARGLACMPRGVHGPRRGESGQNVAPWAPGRVLLPHGPATLAKRRAVRPELGGPMAVAQTWRPRAPGRSSSSGTRPPGPSARRGSHGSRATPVQPNRWEVGACWAAASRGHVPASIRGHPRLDRQGNCISQSGTARPLSATAFLGPVVVGQVC